jgi:hypothetical protein
MVIATVTVDDYIAAHRLHHRRRTKILYLVWVAVLTIGIVIAFFSGRMWAPIIILGGLGALLGQWWDDRIGLPNKVRKLYGQFKGISEPREISWTPEFVESRSPNGQGKRKWSDYVRFRENDEVLLLYITDQLWEAFPKRCFDGTQLGEFRMHAMAAGET